MGAPMLLAETFNEVLESLPDDWTDLAFDLRIHDESRYVEAATYMVVVNAQPYSKHDWHWRVNVAHRFGHGAAAPPTHGTLRNLDEAGIDGELRVREITQGRAESVPMWGRPAAVSQEFRKSRAQ